jgi:hypothetical protein
MHFQWKSYPSPNFTANAHFSDAVFISVEWPTCHGQYVEWPPCHGQFKVFIDADTNGVGALYTLYRRH